MYEFGNCLNLLLMFVTLHLSAESVIEGQDQPAHTFISVSKTSSTVIQPTEIFSSCKHQQFEFRGIEVNPFQNKNFLTF